jgi:DNA-binding transcriptional LysR family regulator
MTPLFCECGQNPATLAGRCRSCYFRAAHSRHRFAGFREQVLARDNFRCLVCQESHRLAVHHRRPGVNEPEFLVTVCAACHARIHRLRAIRRWIPEPLVALWIEQHPGVPVQLQFFA